MSMLSADMFYNVSRRLCEIFVYEDIFGGKSVMLVGDLLQLKPINGPYIFERPKEKKNRPFHEASPLWNSFEVVVLSTNHRQGEHSTWTQVLNRIRLGQFTSKDRHLLESRRIQMNGPIIYSDACNVFYTNDEVERHNDAMLNELPTCLYEISAIGLFPKGYNPKVIWNYG